ncbi:RecQ family ATP-dependent DNA helicase [Limosilactobacillus kribbianus]|uniref:RecQ family ATP-dependent DNA helicase n=1 Tax=Limosilactobacillus kribbianus TaxID=2982695 RepID=UPI0022648170|nr:RecQ family ATP-dependent DNA helicase [Limosilactobacillus kribbianus]
MIKTDQIYQVLHQRFGYQDFRDGQLETITALLSGHDTLTILPTGAGKSLLYQLPAYLLPSGVVIVSPLISLMQDQVDRLRQQGERRVIMLTGQLQGRDRREVLNSLDQYRFIFASPEMLTNSQVLQALRRVRPSLLVVDEAHCISQWGPDFRPEYLLLKQLRVQLSGVVTLMLTATATPQVRQDIIKKLGLDFDHVRQVIRSVNRPNIFLAVNRVEDADAKQAELVHLVKTLPGPGIIYFASRKLATQQAIMLAQETGLAVAPYHAGMAALERFNIQQQFMANQLQLICATSAFGMGVDKTDLRYIIHYHLPANLASYMQEIGRAGRDGQQSVAVLLYAPGDEGLQSQLTTIDLPSEALLTQVQQGKLQPAVLGEQKELFAFYLKQGYSPRQILRAFHHRQHQLAFNLQKMLDYVGLDRCRRSYLLNYFGEEAAPGQDACCDLDQPDWERHLPMPASPAPAKGPGLDWQARLRELLNVKSWLDKG